MDERTKAALNNAFLNFSCSEDNGVLTMGIERYAAIPGVEAVRVTLKGKDPKTGREIPPDLYQVEFCNGKNQDKSRRLPLYGRYALSFEAIAENGVSLGSFRADHPVEIRNRSCRPRVRYQLQRDRKWTRLTIESNCPRRWTGRLWLELDGRSVPLFNEGNRETCSFWLWRDLGEPRLLSDDPELTPEKRKD